MAADGPKEHISKQLEQDLWDVPTMSAVLAAKKASRNQKGEVVNMFALKTDTNEGNELVAFLDNLQANIGEIEDGTRMQVAVQSMAHWMPIDIQVKDGTVNAVLMEAAPTPMTPSILNQLQNRFPDGDVYTFVPDRVQINGKDRDRFIQFDDNSCSRFSLQHMFHMSSMDNLYDVLAANKGHMPPHPKFAMSQKEYFEFNPQNAPADLAFMFRDTQSLGVLGSLKQELQDTVINKKGETLAESVARNIVTHDGKAHNRAILNFKDKKTLETQKFIQKMSDAEIDSMLQNRTGEQFLTGGIKARTQDKQNQVAKKDDDAVILNQTLLNSKRSIKDFVTNAKGDLQTISGFVKDTDAEMKASLTEIDAELTSLQQSAMNLDKNNPNLSDSIEILKAQLNSVDMGVRKMQSVYVEKLNADSLKQSDINVQSAHKSLVIMGDLANKSRHQVEINQSNHRTLKNTLKSAGSKIKGAFTSGFDKISKRETTPTRQHASEEELVQLDEPMDLKRSSKAKVK